MDKSEILKMVEEICKKYNYPIPKIEFSNKMIRTLGRCFWNQNLIKLSAKFCKAGSKTEVENLIKHELGHMRHHDHGIGFHQEMIKMGVSGGFENARTLQKPERKYKKRHHIYTNVPTAILTDIIRY